uniref:Vacuolar import/degradation Vid27 C-terminal domain-containing protein n=1 Tax=Arcella intermedia TaxID=1963864 RepID=A0A6B2L2E4_9EUKA
MVVRSYGTSIDFFNEEGNKTPGYSIKDSKNKVFSPKKIIFKNAGDQILAISESRSTLTAIDTETGKNLYDCAIKLNHPDINARIDELVTEKKFSNLDKNQGLRFLGACGNAVVTLNWDPRTPVKSAAVNEYVAEQAHTAKTRCTALSNTKYGHFASGYKDGTIRLFTYKKMGKPKTLLNQFADPILGIDVSANGEWLVWTTKAYLAVLKTTWSEGGRNFSAFEKSLPAQHRMPVILRLSEADLKKYKIKQVSFTPARFDNSGVADATETEIITTTGSCLVLFDFEKVKKYQKESKTTLLTPMIFKQKKTVDDKSFTYNSNSAVAALADELNIINLNLSKESDDDKDDKSQSEEESSEGVTGKQKSESESEGSEQEDCKEDSSSSEASPPPKSTKKSTTKKLNKKASSSGSEYSYESDEDDDVDDEGNLVSPAKAILAKKTPKFLDRKTPKSTPIQNTSKSTPKSAYKQTPKATPKPKKPSSSSTDTDEESTKSS